jgi:hypothetical protein
MPDAMPRSAAPAIDEPPARAELAVCAPFVAALAPRKAPPAAKVAADGRANAMLRFVWSDDYFALRRQLGLGIG